VSAPFSLTAAMREVEAQYRHEIRLTRCDRCEALAKRKVIIHTRAELGDLVLLFCQHHYNSHQPKIAELCDAGTCTVAPVQESE
jgi:NMD protein affecting ribosome stability and mRNA decay